MMTASPCADQFAHEVVHGGLGADVDALGRLVENDHLGLRRQPFGDDHLLLVAARQRADILVERGGAQVEALRVVARQRELLGQPQEARRARCASARAAMTFWKIGMPITTPCLPRSSGT